MAVADRASFPDRHVTPAEPLTGLSLERRTQSLAAAMVAAEKSPELSMISRPRAFESDMFTQAESGLVA